MLRSRWQPQLPRQQQIAHAENIDVVATAINNLLQAGRCLSNP